MRKMIHDQRDNPYLNRRRCTQPLQEPACERASSFLVSRRDDAGSAVTNDHLSCLGLGEIMREDRKRKYGTGLCIGSLPLRKFGQRIQAVAGMAEDIALRMPFWILGRTTKRMDFGEMFNPSGVGQEEKPARGASAGRRPSEPRCPHA